MPFLSPTAFLIGFTEDNAGILHRVVTVHLQIALHLAFQVKKAVPRKAVQHMVKKSDAGRQIRFSGAVQI